MNNFELRVPPGTKWLSKREDGTQLGVNPMKPRGLTHNVERTNRTLIEHRAIAIGDKDYNVISQEILNPYSKSPAKITSITSGPYAFSNRFLEHRTMEFRFENGEQVIARMKGGNKIGGYNFLPPNRKYLRGYKGKIEKLAIKIGENANGCERPFLRRIAGVMFKILKHI